jgi:hypothetical protein
MPKDSTTENGIKLLLDIFKQQANVAKDRLDAKVKRLNDAATQRVQDERGEEAATLPPNPATAQRVPTAIITTTFETDDEMNDRDNGQRNNVPVITQDEDKIPTAMCSSQRILRSETRSLTDKFLYNAMEFPGITTNITAKSTASRRYTQQFITDWANAVIDKETGELMEYKHLLNDPRHRERWQNSFGREI